MGVPLPALGDTSWYDWATEIHNQVDAWVGGGGSGTGGIDGGSADSEFGGTPPIDGGDA